MKDRIEIDGVEYQRIKPTARSRHIVLLGDGGLTYVGFIDISTDIYPKTIYDARCVIRWGTTHHIGELAETGPMENTRLGMACDFVMSRPPIGFHPCNEDAWT